MASGGTGTTTGTTAGTTAADAQMMTHVMVTQLAMLTARLRRDGMQVPMAADGRRRDGTTTTPTPIVIAMAAASATAAGHTIAVTGIRQPVIAAATAAAAAADHLDAAAAPVAAMLTVDSVPEIDTTIMAGMATMLPHGVTATVVTGTELQTAAATIAVMTAAEVTTAAMTTVTVTTGAATMTAMIVVVGVTMIAAGASMQTTGHVNAIMKGVIAMAVMHATAMTSAAAMRVRGIGLTIPAETAAIATSAAAVAMATTTTVGVMRSRQGGAAGAQRNGACVMLATRASHQRPQPPHQLLQQLDLLVRPPLTQEWHGLLQAAMRPRRPSFPQVPTAL